jgi:probable F420-dependent oxidoreductase
MRVVATLPQDDLNKAAKAAVRFEADGYDGLKTSELAHDPFLPLAVAATCTTKPELVTGITIAFARSPMIVANMSYDLYASSKGRFALGLGTQVKGHNERRFSVPWSAPAPRLKEYVESLRAIWRAWEYGEKLNYVGEHYRFTLMTPVFSPKPTGLPIIPITIAAVGPGMLRLAGRHCDGVRLHSFCTRKYMDEAIMPAVTEGLAASGLKRENFEVVSGGYILTAPDEDTVRKGFEWIRERIAFYGSTRTYMPVWETHGLVDLGLKLHAMSLKGQWKEMAKEISDDTVRLFAAIGTHDVIVKEIEKRYCGVSDTVYTHHVPAIDPKIPPDLLQDIKRLPSAFKGFNTGHWVK